MDSISAELSKRSSFTLSYSTPSIMINGSVELADTAPRSFIPQLSSPGAPEERVIITPGTCPCNACTGLDIAPLFSSILSETTVTAPVNVSFFCEPYPTTTTSSRTSLSSCIFTLTIICVPTSTSWSL